ncbi:MAG: hypothetical protein JW940_22635 [Polyangiaceae bacterium]|nr:hypothetical protein [Polyangiaceae bacterium]
MRDGGDATTGGDASSGGNAATTGGRPSETGGAETGGNIETGGTLETGGEPSTGGIASETGGQTSAAGGTGGQPDAANAGAAGESTPDECPDDPTKTTPGLCGCSMAETDCLVHRYQFNGSYAAQALDWIGDADGVIVNTTASGGEVTLSGRTVSPQYVDFPNNILSELTDATLEIWVTWSGGAAAQKLLDFGDNTTYMGTTTANTYLNITPQTSGTVGLRASFSLGGRSAAVNADASQPLPVGQMSYVAVVVDDSTYTLTLYLNGEYQSSVPLPGALADLSDTNNWLGRSQASADPYFGGTIHEFRIFRVARTDEQIAESYRAGPDDLPGQ